MRTYNLVIDKYILPNIGHFKIRDIRSYDIQVFYDRLLEDTVGTHTVRKIHVVLHGSLERAVRLGSISNNPASLVIPPKEPTREMQIFNESEVSQMLVAAHGNYLEPILHLAVTIGMRQMELLGLKWTDLDWVNQSIKIERQLARSNGKEIQFTQPKTKYGRRTVVLGLRSIDVLRDRYERQNQTRQKAGEIWVEHGLIFTTRYGTPHHPRNLLRDFKIMLEKAGLPIIRFHDLRHTAASLMLNHNIPVIVVSRRLGHAKPSITLDVYGHLIPSMQIEAAQKIDELVTPVELHRIAPDCTQ